jgi:hypothetical protein
MLANSIRRQVNSFSPLLGASAHLRFFSSSKSIVCPNKDK